MPKLTHADLIEVGAHLGYTSFTNGVCHGFSFMWAQALLAQDEECFFKRLELIAFYNPNFKDLITEIEKAKKKAHQPSQLTQQEIDLLDIPAFFDGIEMYLNTEKHSDLLDKKKVNQHDINTIYPFIKPKKYGR